MADTMTSGTFGATAQYVPTEAELDAYEATLRLNAANARVVHERAASRRSEADEQLAKFTQAADEERREICASHYARALQGAQMLASFGQNADVANRNFANRAAAIRPVE